MADQPTLHRRLNLPLLTIYGVGTMVGGGFYALLGKIAGEAGTAAPVAFAVSGVLALFSALSFGELAARFPRSAGESHYVQQAFGRPRLAAVVGWLVIATGVVSAATLANAFEGFFQDFVTSPRWLVITLLVVALGAVAAWGIAESVALAAVITALEVGGLLWVVAIGAGRLREVPSRLSELVPLDAAAWPGIIVGAFLAFYAFVGFEDLVNEAEEVVDPERTLPRGILLALGITTTLYLLVGTVAVLSVPAAELAASRTPLATVAEAAGHAAGPAMGLISMLAGVNGALVQVVMASRVAYGMADQGNAPRVLGRVHPRTRTPLAATALVSTVALVLALWFPLVPLARTTSGILLVVFALVNVSLLVVKRRTPEVPEGTLRVPAWVPAVGALLSLAFVGLQVARALS